MVKLNKQLIKEYEKKHHNVKIKYQKIPNDDFSTKMLTSLSNGKGPDVINMDDAALQGDYIPKKLVDPIDPKAFHKDSLDNLTKQYAPHALDGAKGKDGKQYGVPSELDATAFVINTKHFKDAGLNPNKPPKTWKDVAKDGKQLVGSGHKQSFNFPYVHSGWYMDSYQTLLSQTGGALANKGCTKPTASDPKSVQAMQLWDSLARKNHIADPSKASREASDPFSDVTHGKQSMSLTYPWSMQQIKKSNPKVYKHLKVVPVPQINPGDPHTRWYGYDWAVNAASKQKKESWKFIAFLSSHSNEWLSKVGFFQGQKGWEHTKAGKEIDFRSAWSKAYSTDGTFDKVCPHWSEFKDTMQDTINHVVFDGKSPQSELNKMDDRLKSSVD